MVRASGKPTVAQSALRWLSFGVISNYSSWLHRVTADPSVRRVCRSRNSCADTHTSLRRSDTLPNGHSHFLTANISLRVVFCTEAGPTHSLRFRTPTSARYPLRQQTIPNCDMAAQRCPLLRRARYRFHPCSSRFDNAARHCYGFVKQPPISKGGPSQHLGLTRWTAADLRGVLAIFGWRT